VTNTSVA